MRIDGYYTIYGKRYPSVTTILSVLSKPALYYYYAQLSHTTTKSMLSTATFKEVWSELNKQQSKTKDRGSDVHSYLEAYFKKADYIPQVDSPYMQAVKNFLEKEGKEFELIMSERQVHSLTHGFAGTLDAIIKHKDKVYVVDFKTNKSARIFNEASLQLSAYQEAALEQSLVHKIDARMVICFGLEGKYQIKSVENCFDTFLAAQKLWQWIQDKQ